MTVHAFSIVPTRPHHTLLAPTILASLSPPPRRSLPSLPSATILLAFQLRAFCDTEHQFVQYLSRRTRNLIEGVAALYPESQSSTPAPVTTETSPKAARARTRAVPSPPSPFRENWAVDRADFLSSIREFQETASQVQNTRQYRDYFRLTEADPTHDDPLLTYLSPANAENSTSTNILQITPHTSTTPPSRSPTETSDQIRNNMANEELLAQI